MPLCTGRVYLALDADIARLRDELREVVKSLSTLQSELASLRTDIVWIKNITEDVCIDVDDLMQFKWRICGISAGVSVAISVGLYLVWG